MASRLRNYLYPMPSKPATKINSSPAPEIGGPCPLIHTAQKDAPTSHGHSIGAGPAPFFSLLT
jgi:hypothetical protein